MANQAKLEAVLTLKDKMTPELKNTEKGFEKFGDTIGKTVKRTVFAIGAITGAVGILAFKTGGDLEKTRIAFETMLGSAEDAGKLLEELTDFAKKTPFDLPGVQTSTTQLLAMGAASRDDAIPILKALGDVTAGVNGDLGRIAYNFGQVAAQGVLTGVELRDFARAGIPLIEELADMFGVTEGSIKDMVSAGEIGFDDVREAFVNMSGEGGKFEDLMYKQSETMPGQIENIKDAFGILTRQIIGIDPEGVIREGGLFDKFKGVLQGVLTEMDNFDVSAETISITLDETLGETINSVSGLFEKFGIDVGGVSEQFSFLEIIISPLIGLVEAFGFVVQFGASMMEALKGQAEALATPLITIFDTLKKIAEFPSNMLDFKGVGDKIKGFGAGLVPDFRADGGPVSGGSPYIVGEKGPELFVPGQSGSIVPNDKIGSSVNINFNNPVVRNDADLDSIISAVKQSLNRELSVTQMGI